MNTTLQAVITTLEDLFSVFNDKFFESNLSKPVITVSPDNKGGKLNGWCTSWKPWKDGEGDYYEINICAEHLNRTIEEIAETMLHEMVHLFCAEQGVKDTSRAGTYHNNKYKEAAEAHGLTCEKDDKYGWTKTGLTEEAKAEVNGFSDMIGKTTFDLFREAEVKEEKEKGKGNSRKYVCPNCGLIIRATKQVRVSCMDCELELVEEQ